DEMRGTYYQERRADAGTGTEAQRSVDVLDGDVGLTRPPSEDAADNPTARVVRVDGQRTVNQRHHGADVLAEIGQRLSGMRQDAGVVAGHFQGSPCEINALENVCFPVFATIVNK